MADVLACLVAVLVLLNIATFADYRKAHADRTSLRLSLSASQTLARQAGAETEKQRNLRYNAREKILHICGDESLSLRLRVERIKDVLEEP
jgi:hypothetical protein